MLEKVKNKQVQKQVLKLSEPERSIFEEYLRGTIHSENPQICDASTALISAGGKRVRPAFAYLAGRNFNCIFQDFLPLMASLELIHTGSLIHDDIIDGAKTRRGKSTANSYLGEKSAIFIGDFLVGRALELVAEYQNPRINQSLNHTIVEMCKGEIAQINDYFATEQSYKNYFYRIRRKTALLFAGSTECGAALAGASDGEINKMWCYGYNLGMAFQIFDDILDITADETTLGKPVGSDLRQGNLTLPVLYALKNSPQKAQLKAKILAIPQDETAVSQVINLINDTDAMEFSENMAREFVARAKKSLEFLPKSKEQQQLMDIADYMVDRKN